MINNLPIKCMSSCCKMRLFNFIDVNDKPLYHYDKITLDSLVTQNNNSNPFNKYLWIKKATGLGVSEFMLRFMAWLCLKDNTL
jgi:hypothetical protein